MARQTGTLVHAPLAAHPPIHMANEDGCGSSSSLAPSSVHSSSGTTRHDPLSVSQGSYELQVLPGKAKKARNIATSETTSDDDLDLPAGRPDSPTRSVKKAMSRVPLLVRSSPAQGTGKQAIDCCQAPWSLIAPSALDACTNPTMHKMHGISFATRANFDPRVIWRPAYSFFQSRRV